MHHQGKEGDGDPTVEPGIGAGIFEEVKHPGQHRAADHDPQGGALDQVKDKRFWGGLIETVAFLDRKGGIDAEGQGDRRAGQDQDADVKQAGPDRAQRPAAHNFIQIIESSGKPEYQRHQQTEAGGQQAETGALPGISLGFAVFLPVVDIGKLFR